MPRSRATRIADVGEVVALLDEELRAEHRRRGGAGTSSCSRSAAVGSRPGSRTTRMSRSALSRCDERHARRTTRSELGSSLASASSRSAIGLAGALPNSRSSRRSSVSRTSRLASTSSATWRSATSRSACRFSILKNPLSAAGDARLRVDLALAQALDQRLRRQVDQHDLVGRCRARGRGRSRARARRSARATVSLSDSRCWTLTVEKTSMPASSTSAMSS